MATLKTNLMQYATDGLVRNRPDGNLLTGQKILAQATYTAAAGDAAADILQIVQLPVGAQVLPEECYILSEGIGGTGVTLSKVGDALDDDRYCATALALTAAGLVKFTIPVGAGLAERYRIASGATIIQAILAGTLPATAGKKVSIGIVYIMP